MGLSISVCRFSSRKINKEDRKGWTGKLSRGSLVIKSYKLSTKEIRSKTGVAVSSMMEMAKGVAMYIVQKHHPELLKCKMHC